MNQSRHKKCKSKVILPSYYWTTFGNVKTKNANVEIYHNIQNTNNARKGILSSNKKAKLANMENECVYVQFSGLVFPKISAFKHTHKQTLQLY